MREHGTSSLACARQVQSKAGEGLAGLRWQFGCTVLGSAGNSAATVLGSARPGSNVVVVPTSTDHGDPQEYARVQGTRRSQGLQH